MEEEKLFMVSVADVLFLDPETDAYIGKAEALKSSGIVQEMSSLEQRGGKLNELLLEFMHSKNLTINMQSATFDMKYLAFQTGTPISSGEDSVWAWNECVKVTNGSATLANTPIGKVFANVDGKVIEVTPTLKTINVGGGVNGNITVSYKYQGKDSKVVIGTTDQPLTVKAILLIDSYNQNGLTGQYQVEIPRLKFNGALNYDLASDNVANYDISGKALAVEGACGKKIYGTFKFVPKKESDIVKSVVTLAAIPGKLTLKKNEQVTLRVIGVTSSSLENNIELDNAEVTFESKQSNFASVDNATGLVKGVAAGETDITVSYQGMQTSVHVTVTA